MLNLNHQLYLLISNFLEKHQKLEKFKQLSNSATFDSSVDFLGNCDNWMNDKSLITIGKNGLILGELAVFSYGGKIEIGEDCYIGQGTRIRSANSIKIGNEVMISDNDTIYDTDAHSLNHTLRHQEFVEVVILNNLIKDAKELDVKSAPVSIEDHVWIGFNAAILKGVTIARVQIG